MQAGPSARKQSGQVFLVLNLCYSLQRGSNGFIAEKTITIQRIKRGSNIFQGGGGGATFSREGGVQMLISILTHITCDFPGGGGPDHLSPSGSAHRNSQ